MILCSSLIKKSATGTILCSSSGNTLPTSLCFSFHFHSWKHSPFKKSDMNLIKCYLEYPGGERSEPGTACRSWRGRSSVHNGTDFFGPYIGRLFEN